MRKHVRVVQLVPIKRQTLDEFLDRAFRLEREERHAKGNVPPLTWVVGEAETLTELVDDVFGLFFLGLWGCVGE